MSRLTLPGRVEGGKLIVDRSLLRDEIAKMPDGDVEVSVYKPASERQSRYYHGPVLTAICDHTGYDHDTAHAEMKQMHNNGKSTRGLDTVAYSAFTERVVRWAAEWLGVVIEDPPSQPPPTD